MGGNISLSDSVSEPRNLIDSLPASVRDAFYYAQFDWEVSVAARMHKEGRSPGYIIRYLQEQDELARELDESPASVFMRQLASGETEPVQKRPLFHHDKAHPLAGKTVVISQGPYQGQPFYVQDWSDRVFKQDWFKLVHTRAVCRDYQGRSEGQSDDTEVVYGQIRGLSKLMHNSELGDVIVTRTVARAVKNFLNPDRRISK